MVEEKKELSGWQAFEMANKYYLIIIGIVMLAVIPFTLYFDSGNYFSVSINLIIGTITLALGIFSKVSEKK